MMKKDRSSYHSRVQRALLEYSFLRWESAVIIAITALMTAGSWLLGSLNFIPDWIWWGCLIFGCFSEAALVYTSLNDPEVGHQVVFRLLQDEFNPKQLQSHDLQTSIEQAFDYRGRIEAAIRKQSDTPLKSVLTETAQQIDQWLKNLYNLARRLDRYQDEAIQLNKDYTRVSQRIYQLQQQLNTEHNQTVAQQIQFTLEGMQRQLETIKKVQDMMRQAELQLEHTLSALGTIYSQAMLFDAKRLNEHQVGKLQEEVTEEINQLDDLLLAMDEIYATDIVSKL